MKVTSWLRRILGGLLLLTLVSLVGIKLFWPDRFIVNTPLRSLFITKEITGSTLDQRISLAEGFSLSIYANGLDNARVLRFTPSGDLLVSTPRTGQVWLVKKDQNGDGQADGQRVLVEQLNRPHGIELLDEWLYIAESDGVARIAFDAANGSVSGEITRIITGLPGGGNHWSRTIHKGPDGWIYLTIGSSCNACEEEDNRRAAMHRFRSDGSDLQFYATGLRNSVDFDWSTDGTLYATDNGRDLLGDDLPPDELNRIRANGFYGWPYAWGDGQPDPDLGLLKPELVKNSLPPAHQFKAHVAPLGISFLNGNALPPAYRGAALVAQHGSWNRTRKSGYKVVSLHWSPTGDISERDFMTGFEHNEEVIGRPAFVIQGPDGAIYVSDDYTGSIYRIAYAEPQQQLSMTPPDKHPQPQNRREEPSERQRVSSEDGIRIGQSLYEKHACSSCHQDSEVSGSATAKKLTGLSAKYDLRSLAAFLQTPTPPMPIFPLDEAEKEALASYLLQRK